MTTNNTAFNDSLDAGAIVAIGLIGGGLAVAAGTLLRTPERREMVARIARELGLPQVGREIAAGLFLKLSAYVAGHNAIDGGH